MNLLAATEDGLYRLVDQESERLAAGDMAAVAVVDGAAWAVADDTELLRLAPSEAPRAVARHHRPLRCLLATPDRVLAGTADAGLVDLRNGRLEPVEGFEAAPGREAWYTPWGGPPDTRSLAAADDGILYANVHVGGILRSDDRGRSWQPTIDVDADVHQVACAGPLVLAATAYGLAVSDDRGASWSWRTEGLHARYARAVAVAGDTVLVSVSQGPGGRQAGLYRGGVGVDGALERCVDGLPETFAGNVDTGCLLADGRVVAASDGVGLYWSTDAGGSWRPLPADLPRVRGLAPAPRSQSSSVE